MGAGSFSDNTTLWRAVNETNTQQVRLKDIFQRIGGLSEQCRHGGNADWSPIELVDHDGQQLSIRRIKTGLVDLQALQCRCGRLNGDVRGTSYLYLIANATQEAVRDPRCAATASRNQRGGVSGDLNPKDASGATDDCREVTIVVEVESLHSTETITQRRGEHADTCCGTNEGEWRNVESQRLRRTTIADDDVN
jgi:hypothetical protein